jgi:hypothetical protein
LAKRNDLVAPPPYKGQWELRFGEKDAADGWDELCKQAPGPTREAYDAISRNPRDRTNPHRQHRLRSALGTRTVRGAVLEQWQYEVTGAGRIWYCPDDKASIVWLTKATVGHPARTDK